MKVKGEQLEFISQINRDGSGITPIVSCNHDNEEFNIIPLSISEKTYIAHGFNSYIVKLKYTIIDGWVKLNGENYPKPGKPVLVFGKNESGKERILRAIWVPKFHMNDEDFEEFRGDLDYNEEKDMFYWPEGWYEWNEHEETHWQISFPITHYRNLPLYPNDI